MALTKLATILNKISSLPTLIKGDASSVKGYFDYDVNVVKNYINNSLIPEIETDFATKNDLQSLAIGALGEDFATEAMMANDMKKDIAGGVLSYNKSLDLAPKSSVVNATLTAAGWSGSSAPYTQSVSVAGATASNNIIFDLGMSATSIQIETSNYAMLKASSQTTNSVTISAFGDKPTIDIPVQFVILG